MEITISLPEDVANVLRANGGDIQREVLEATSLEGYRNGVLSQAQVRRILGFKTDMQTDAFLKKHGVYLEYDLDDLKRETAFSINCQ